MEYFPAPLEALVEQFARLPGIGGKTAQRLAFHVLSLPEEDAQAFADAIVTAKRTVTYCPVCRNFTAGGLCPICSSPKRDDSVICVVADPRDVAAMERGREFNGKYHVLHGVLHGDDIGQLEEGGLQNGVGAAAQTQLTGDLDGVDGVEPGFLLRQGALHGSGQVLLQTLGVPRAVQQEHAALL